jgi:uncharacterized damage-inducible protein DinB
LKKQVITDRKTKATAMLDLATGNSNQGAIKELLHQYAAHNLWANQQITTTIKLLPAAIIEQEIVSSFSSIYKTVLHLLDAESIWWQRIKLVEHIDIPSQHFDDNFEALQQKLLQQSLQLEQWINAANEYQLLHVFGYQRSKSEQQKQPVFQVLLHLFNHGSYHRGQLVTLLRQAGITKIPPTDFNDWLRQKKS